MSTCDARKTFILAILYDALYLYYAVIHCKFFSNEPYSVNVKAQILTRRLSRGINVTRLACRHGEVGVMKPNNPFTRSSKHRAIIEQTSSKCIQNTRARRVLYNWSMFAPCLLDVCLMFA